jgi:hypothetical protein
MISAMSAIPPTPAPIPALAPVESPDGDMFVLGFVLGSAEVVVGVDVGTDVRDIGVVAEAVLLLAGVDDTPSN